MVNGIGDGIQVPDSGLLTADPNHRNSETPSGGLCGRPQMEANGHEESHLRSQGSNSYLPSPLSHLLTKAPVPSSPQHAMMPRSTHLWLPLAVC